MIKFVIDMMGGDNGSAVTNNAVREFIKNHQDVYCYLVGKKEEIAKIERTEIIDARDVITMESGALEVLRKRDSSMVKAVKLTKKEGYDAVISCGSTGAFLSASTLVLKKIKGVKRPALVTQFPHFTNNKHITILDVGASNENTAEQLAQFAFMGSLYSKVVDEIENPKVALLSNGSEEGKGSPVGKEAFKLIQEANKVNFIGNEEANFIFIGEADVLVCDGYSGNVMLKSTEGTAKSMGLLLKNAFSKSFATKLGYLLARSGIKELKDTFDPKKVGGALLIGVNSIAVKAHGNSNEEGFYNALELAYNLKKHDIVKAIEEGFKE